MRIQHDDKTLRAAYYRGLFREYLPGVGVVLILFAIVFIFRGSMTQDAARRRNQLRFPLRQQEAFILDFRVAPLSNRGDPPLSVAVFNINGKEATVLRTPALHIGQKIRVYYRDSPEFGVLVDHIEALP